MCLNLEATLTNEINNSNSKPLTCFNLGIFGSPENLVGKGGHAEVYKGQLPDGQVIAVKRLMKNEKDAADRAGDFLTELGIIAHINHPNATRLVGFGIDRGLYFVLQFAPQGSLASMLFGALLIPSLILLCACLELLLQLILR